MQTKPNQDLTKKKIDLYADSCTEKSYNVPTALFALGRSINQNNQDNNNQTNQKSQIKNSPKK